MSEVVEN